MAPALEKPGGRPTTTHNNVPLKRLFQCRLQVVLGNDAAAGAGRPGAGPDFEHFIPEILLV
jgi:hypothetical protein